MGAPKGNQYYLLRETHGRSKQFASPEEFWQAFLEYVEYAQKNPWQTNEAIKSGPGAGTIIQIPTARPLTRSGFASYLGMTWKGVESYGKEESYKDFFPVFTRAMQIIDTQQLEGAMVGAFNANIVARVQGLKEQTDHTTDGQPINILNLGTGKKPDETN